MNIDNLFDTSLEMSVIGKYAFDGQETSDTAELDCLFETGDFYGIETKKVIEKIFELKNAGEMFDVTSLYRFNGQIDCSIAMQAARDFHGSFEVIKDHAKKISELAKQRKALSMIMNLTTIVGSNQNHTAKMSAVSEAMNDIATLMTSVTKKDKTISTAMDKVIAYCESRADGKIENGIKTGINAIDEAMGDRGIGKTDLIVIGARPKTGKTLVSLAIAANLAMDDKKVLFFSLEMSEFELGVRLMANASFMKPSDIYGYVGHDNDEFWTNVSTATYKLAHKDLYIEDTPALKIQQIKAISKQFSARLSGLDLIVVDYLQKAGVNDRGRHDLAVGEISSGLKDLAKEIDCPVVALSQLNRNGKGKPDMTHLRESGQIEQDADAIFLLHNFVDTGNDEDLFKHPIVEVNMPAYRHGAGAGPFYLTKAGGRIKDADASDINKAIEANRQATGESEQRKRPTGFNPGGFGGGFVPQ